MNDRLEPEDVLIGELVALPRRKSQRNQDGTYVAGEAGDREPAFMDDALRTKILMYVQAGCTYTIAMRAVGLKKHTMSVWKRKAREGIEPYVTFIGEMEMYEAKGEAQLVAAVAIAARNDPHVALKMLRARFPQRWKDDRIEVEDEDEILVDEPLTTVEHLSEVMAALEEANLRPMQAEG